MKSTLDKLNLRPQERRLLVIVALVVFIVLNIWFVWPYFGEWGKTELAIQRSRATLKRYQQEIAKKPIYEKRQKELSSIGELLVGELDMEKIVRSTASQTQGFQILTSDSRSRIGSANANTNQFFQEQTLTIQFTSGGKELVDFLVGIAAQNTLIRVREMSVRPDPTQTRLNGSMVFVGNYLRKPAAKSSRANTAPRRRT
jgi:Tfp pilus assembly protein PilO